MSWQEFTLNEICTTQYGYTASATEESIGPKFLRITDIVNSTIDWSTVPYCQINENELDKYLLQKGDVVIARTGATTGYAKLIRDDDINAVFASYLVRLKLNLDVAYPGFVGRLLESDVYKKFVEGIKGGAAQPNANAKTLTLFKLKLPDLPTQGRVADVLSNYDDLIENNKRRIELLEESARQLYKEWFVRFRFPGHEHVKIIDGVPEGWNPRNLSDIVTVVKDTVDPKNIPETTPYIGLEHLPRRSITLNEWENAGKVTSSKFSFKCGDILFGKIRPYFHKVGFTLTDGITSSDAIVLRPKMQSHYCIALAEVSSDAFVALASKTVREGSKMPRADWDVLKNRIVLEPPEAILNVFNNQIEGILNQCKLLSFQNFNLIKGRDLLLPKLMSGEIAV